jgi:hypothetical protein
MSDDLCIDFLGQLEHMKYRLKEEYDELEIMRVLVNPKHLKDIMSAPSVLRFLPEILGVELDKLSRLAGIDIDIDKHVPYEQIQFVMRHNK